MTVQPGFEITLFSKFDGPLTKEISLAPDGNIKSDGSACVMSRGTARRVAISNARDLATLIEQIRSTEALALGSLRQGLPDQVEIVTKRVLDQINGAAQPDIIARTGNDILYRHGAAAFALLDYDTKGIPTEVAARLDERGGFLPALQSVIPELAAAAKVRRRSTSARLYRTDTGEELAGSSGMHVFVEVRDGTDIERFLRTLHARCWLVGLGWMMVGAGGQLLERSVIDRVVGSPERLVFEGPPLILPPLSQDAESRRPIAIDGAALDTTAACPPLTIVEQQRLAELVAKEQQRLAPESAKARERFIERQSRQLAERTGMDASRARRVIERQCSGILLPEMILPFDDAQLTSITVAEVLADPARFEGETLADPLEGPEYGVCKARIMRRADGTPWIHSFAHGRTIYALKHDVRSVEAALNKAPADETAELFVRLVLGADLDADEIERLRDIVNTRTGLGKRALNAKLKRAQQDHTARQANDERQRRLAERADARPRLRAPAPDAERLPIVTAIDEVLASVAHCEPPMRDAEGRPTEVRDRIPIMLHALLETDIDIDEADPTARPCDAAVDPA